MLIQEKATVGRYVSMKSEDRMRTHSSLFLYLVLFILIVYPLGAMAAESENEPIMGNAAFILTPQEIETLRDRSLENDPVAMFRLANYYALVEDDHAESMIWLEKAAKAGHVIAQHNLAVSLLISSNLKDRTDSIHWFMQSAKQGDGSAMLHLAEIYEAGDIIGKDDLEAKGWYEKAALAGGTTAMIKLAEYYSEGKGTPKDVVKAYTWIIVAESRIHPESITGKAIKNEKNKLAQFLSPAEISDAQNDYVRLSERICR